MIRFETEIKVRSYECDMYGHVNNASFLNYCEFARIEFLEAMGYTLHGLQKDGFIMPIVKIEIEYKTPAYASETLAVSAEWILRGRSSAVFEQNIVKKKDGSLAAHVLVTWVATDLIGKPIPIPQALLDRTEERFGVLPPLKNG